MVTLFQGLIFMDKICLVLWTKYKNYVKTNIEKKGVYSRIMNMIGRGRRNKGRRVQQSKNSNKSNKVIQYTYNQISNSLPIRFLMEINKYTRRG